MRGIERRTEETGRHRKRGLAVVDEVGDLLAQTQRIDRHLVGEQLRGELGLGGILLPAQFGRVRTEIERHPASGEHLAEQARRPEAHGYVLGVGLDHVRDAIARAAMIADSIYVALAEEGLVGRTERDVAWRIEQLAREGGASGARMPFCVRST